MCSVTGLIKKWVKGLRKTLPVSNAFTFDLDGTHFGRLLVAPKGAIPDLADLYGHPWQDYKVCGYRSVVVSRADNRKLGVREVAALEK